MRRRETLRKAIPIPKYWEDHVDSKLSLESFPKQACPFHNEEHGKSFSYSAEKGYWSCFGACHVLGGDVVKMHMVNYHIKDYEEAEKSLASLYGIRLENEVSFDREEPKVNQRDIAYNIAYGKALRAARTPDDWVELDYIMSEYPVKTEKLEMFAERRGL